MSKIIGSIDREVRCLRSHIDAQAASLVASYPDAGLIIRSVPERFVLQAQKEVGVSLSLFRSRAGMDAGAEVVLAAWKGDVTFPGCTPQQDRHATQLCAQQFRLTRESDESWLWTDESTTGTVTSQRLATICIELMEEHLRQPRSAVMSAES